MLTDAFMPPQMLFQDLFFNTSKSAFSFLPAVAGFATANRKQYSGVDDLKKLVFFC
jgi:hypothetical protein